MLMQFYQVAIAVIIGKVASTIALFVWRGVLGAPGRSDASWGEVAAESAALGALVVLSLAYCNYISVRSMIPLWIGCTIGQIFGEWFWRRLDQVSGNRH